MNAYWLSFHRSGTSTAFIRHLKHPCTGRMADIGAMRRWAGNPAVPVGERHQTNVISGWMSCHLVRHPHGRNWLARHAASKTLEIFDAGSPADHQDAGFGDRCQMACICWLLRSFHRIRCRCDSCKLTPIRQHHPVSQKSNKRHWKVWRTLPR